MRSIYYLIKNIIKLAKVLSVDDSGNITFCQVNNLGASRKAMLFNSYGTMSNPPPNSMGIKLNQQGQESNSIVFASDPKNRPIKNLKSGEYAIGNFVTGDYVYFDENGDLRGSVTQDAILDVGRDLLANVTRNVIMVSGTSIELNSPIVNVKTGSFNVTSTTGGTTSSSLSGDIAFSGGSVTHNGTSIDDTHRHDTSTNPSGTPI